MTIDERLRLNIHNKLTELLGTEEADVLMSRMLPVPWHDVATKDDLRVLSVELRSEIAELRSDLRTEIAELRSDLRTEIAELRSDLRTELHDGIVGQTRWLTGYVTTLSVVMLAVARLLF